jgi:hypothetical protein
VTLAVIADLRRRFGLRDLEPRTEMTMTDERMALIELVEKAVFCSPLPPNRPQKTIAFRPSG